MLEEIIHARHPNVVFVYGVVNKTVQQSKGDENRQHRPALCYPW